MTVNDLREKKVAVVGLGENHKHLVEYFDRHGINYTVFQDWKDPAELADLEQFEIIFRTPGLPVLSPAIRRAREAGAQIYSQTRLFFDLCPARIIGVTGTKGKGTTATLIARILEAAGRRVWLAGNIGQDPFEFLEAIKPGDDVVLELSSFQLQDMNKSPHIAVVLKVTSEHLDYHGSVDEYIDAKRPIVNYQWREDFSVLNYDSLVTRSFSTMTPGKIIWNSISQQVNPGCYVFEDKIYLDFMGKTQEVMPVSDVQLIGRFNLENVTAAVAACAAAGVSDKAVIAKVVSEFEGLPHRLEFIRDFGGVKFYNDSFSTTPDTAIAGLGSFAQPIVFIVGGSEKKADYAPLAEAIASHKVRVLIPIGITGPKIAKLARKSGYQGRIIEGHLDAMAEIVRAANEIASPGDVVLLSPASASFDMFKNYKDRGDQFRKAVNTL